MSSRHFSLAAFFVSFFGLAATPLYALNGLSTLQFTPEAGWKGFELVTQGNNISAIADAGYSSTGTATRGLYDGIGAHLTGCVITSHVNNETTPAAVSPFDVDRTKLRQPIASRIDGAVTPFPTSFVTGMGYAYQTIYAGNYHAVNNPNPAASGTAGVAAY